MKQSLLLAVALLFSLTVGAQYPDLTDEAKQLIAQQKAQWKAHSDSAWEVAFPIVVEEAKAGRPYVPWAFRPYDLRQAKIPAMVLVRSVGPASRAVRASWCSMSAASSA